MGGRGKDFLRLRWLCPGDGVRGRSPKPQWDEDAAVVDVVPHRGGWRALGVAPVTACVAPQAPGDAACRTLPAWLGGQV